MDDIKCEYEFESHIDCALELVKYVEITGVTEVVQLCNYKGEGDCIAIASTCKNLPIFKSKNEAFSQVN